MQKITEFFKGKSIFITGGSGFLGKILVEKLLRSCPDLENIYLLIRNKKGHGPEERIKEILRWELFDELKQNNPAVLKKLIAIPGDMTKLGLGICEEDQKILTSKIDIIYNCAATIRFDLPLKEAIITNVRSARELCKIALNCNKLKLLLHVSTAYSNTQNKYIEEKIYPPPIQWNEIIAIVENEKFDRNFEILSHKTMGTQPNTYTFSKQLSEAVFQDMCGGNIPLIINRPSIVLNCKKEPIEGWTDNFNGPFTLTVPIAKGFCNTALLKDRNIALNFVYADNVVKSLIIATWAKFYQNPIDVKDVTVYNACSEIIWKMKYFEETVSECFNKTPAEGRVWMPPNNVFITCWYYYYICFIFSAVIPSIFMDSLLKLTGRKPLLFKLSKKIYIVNETLLYFMSNEFSFEIKNYHRLEEMLTEQDKASFSYLTTPDQQDNNYIATTAFAGLKRFVLRDSYPIKEETFRNTDRLYYVDKVYKFVKLIFVIYILFWKLDTVTFVLNKFSF